MLGIDSNLLAAVVGERRVAIVSATNGKTTTTRLLADALRACGHTVASNHTGANMPAGVAAALGRDLESELAILEVDERWVPKVVDPLRAEVLVLGNLTRDQLDRFGEVRSIAARWRAVCESHPDLAIVANASDPHVVWSVAPARNVTWVALGAPWRADAATCPECAALLDWHVESFRCPECNFTQPPSTYRLTDAALETPTGPVALDLQLPGSWNRMNAALALTTAIAHFDADPTRATIGIRDLAVVSGRFSEVTLPDGRTAKVILAKNPAGWTEVLRWLGERDSGVVLAVNAHVADGRDPSWLWDVPYELFRGRRVVASGERALDVAVRLDYGGVRHTVVDDPAAAAASLPGEVHVIASYTQFTHLTRGSW